MKFWHRVASIKAGDSEFDSEKFDIDFNVPFSTGEDPDISEIIVYNLTDTTISNIKARDYIILNAGYKEDSGNILSGKLESIETKWETVDKVTTITVSDGGVEWRNAKINKTYASGSKASYIMSDLASMLGLEVAEILPKEDVVYKRGKTIHGQVNAALKQLASDTNSKLYINKGKIYVRDKNKGTSNGFLLQSDTGLVGSPEKIEEEDEDGKITVKYEVSSLLNHHIDTDSLIKIKSRTVNGNFRVESGEHTGDFNTDMIVIPM